MIRLGQHFLTHRPTLKKIAAALAMEAGDTVVEIGPGHGELTQELGIRNQELRIVAIEKDKLLAAKLREKFSQDGRVEIIDGDALKVLPRMIQDSRFTLHGYKLVGNIPYYITGYLFRTISELEKKPSRVVLLIQREVAERIIAKPPKMNILAASIQAWAEPKIIARAPRGYFRPSPKVEGAVIALVPRAAAPGRRFLIETYYPFIRILFKQPRKTIFNNLRPLAKDTQVLKENLASAAVNPGDRPQDLSIQKITELSAVF